MQFSRSGEGATRRTSGLVSQNSAVRLRGEAARCAPLAPRAPHSVDIPGTPGAGGPAGDRTRRSAALGPGRQADFLLRKLPRKEVIQPQLPLRLPCYDFTPIMSPTFDGSLPRVGSPASGVAHFRGVTGGVYKARERIHPGMLIHDY